ncbi:MAG: hypothetical protein K2Q18_15070, partial [Bdellovibrionales bacterium]|nr:hypothetical protein [Bdellovibrionales bacterium]
QLFGKVGFFYDSITSKTSDKKIKTFSRFKYFSLGGDFELIQETQHPLSYLMAFKLGIPVLKENYTIPTYKSLDASVRKHDFFISKSRLGIGLQYAPENFVNVPEFGGSLQVFENNFVWLKGSAGYLASYKNRPLNIEINGYLSLFMSSNQKKSLSGSKLELTLDWMFSEKLGILASLSHMALSGDLEATGDSIQLFGIYHFEN